MLDISGNGKSNEGAPPEAFRDTLIEDGVMINAIAVQAEQADQEDLPVCCETRVIGGAGAFVFGTGSVEDYPELMRRKLFHELMARTKQASR